jgi:hypothetical protein
MKRMFAIAAFAALAASCAYGQAGCKGSVLAGVVRDNTQALIPGAKVTLDDGVTATSGSDGRFRFGCVTDGAHKIAAGADGFATRELAVKVPRAAAVEVTLDAGANVQVDVSAEENEPPATDASGPSQTISGSRLQSLADDPDDLLRELQQMAAASGGSPANTTISVDGFQGESALPPKSSIAYIKVNPDQFSAEYREPPFEGSRVEIYTKPGQKAYHGALFLTNGSSFENARDPFSTNAEAIGKQRYGLELTGPVRKTGSDFALTLEHRAIDNYAVVDALTLNSAGAVVATNQSVPDPQRLWLATARLDWQLGAKNTLITTYSANANSLANLGVGGETLAEAGYNSSTYEHMFRVSDITTVSAHLMHEARVSLRWDGSSDVPLSSAPQLQVAGSFIGGGSTLGAQQLHEVNVEADDDAIWTGKTHTLKFGTQMMIYDEHQQLPTNFNGTYVFGGGTAPVLDANNNPTAQTATITGIEQYRRSLLGLSGGSPTAYSNVAGTPAVAFVQVQDALFVEDDWNVGHGVKVSYGLRYFWQTQPTVLNSATPRLGILWSPNKKGTWTVHAHYGIFAGRYPEKYEAEVMREDGVQRVTSTVYNPVNSLSGGNPLVGAPVIHSMRTFDPHISNLLWGGANIGGTRTLPHGWNLSADYYWGRMWNDVRSENINAPLNGVPTGPRPGAANLDVLQMNNSGQGDVSAEFAGIENHTYKRVQFFFGGVRVELVDDTDDNALFTPQSTYSDVGEFAHRTGQQTWNLFGNATFTLPAKVQLSANYNGGGGAHYNITTGFDNNGDGDFNDRPQYATAGTPLCSVNPNATPCSYATPYGQLVSSGGTGVFPRNKGVMPWTVYLDMNVQRSWKLTKNAKAEHQQMLTVNVRSSNVLNHLNVTGVGGVLGSPQFGQAYSADPGRRVEAGARYSF